MSGNPGTIVSIQYLRALAAAMVLLEHISKKSGQVGHQIFSSLHFGYTGVDVFFVISGFIMCFIYMRSRSGTASLLDFWKKRFVRIIPLYWLLTLIALCAYLIAPDKVNSSGGETVIWQSFLLVFGEGQRFLIANGWTLSYEMYFYVLISLSFLIPNKTLGAFFSVALICLIVGTYFSGLTSGLFLSNPFLLEFVFGILIYLLYERRSGRGSSHVGVLLGCVGALGLAAQQVTSSFAESRFISAGVPAAILVYGVVLNEAAIRRFGAGWLGKLGDSSYSMYLFHPFPLKAAGMLYAYIGFASYGIWFESTYWAAVAASVLVSSYYVHVHVEVPLTSLTKMVMQRLSIGPRPVGVLATANEQS